MADFPALPLWTDAYLGDTAHLTNEEHGVYLRLLMYAWRSKGCCLPADDNRLAIMVGMTPGKWRKMKPTIMEFWSLEDGVYRQKKLTKERQFVTNSRAQKSAAGKASVRAKSRKTKDQAPTGVGTYVATGKPTEAPTDPPTDRQQPIPIPISGSGRVDKSTPPPPQAAADSSSSSEREAVSILGEVAKAVGYPDGAKPPKAWSSAEAKRLVRSWMDSGLSRDEIVDRARRSRQVHPEPPTSPKALANFMLIPAAAHNPHASAEAKRAPKEDQLRFWAEKVNGSGYLPQTAIKPSVARELVAAGLVTRKKLRERGIEA